MPKLNQQYPEAVPTPARPAQIALGEPTINMLLDLIESIPEGLAYYDANDRLVLANSKMANCYPLIADMYVVGTTFEEIVRAGVERGQFGPSHGGKEEWIREVLAYHRDPKGVAEYYLDDGRYVRVEERHTSDGGRVGVRTDITEIRKAEAALKESNKSLKRHVRELDASKRVSERQAAGLAELAENQAVLLSTISAHKDRLKRQIKQRKKAERERNEAREQLHQSQKMEAMGTLAGGVAHDFNNILAIMNGLTRLVIEDLPEDSPQRGMLEEAVQAGRRGADLVDHILAFTRKDDETDTLVRLDESVDESLKMLRATLPATIQLDCQIPTLQARERAEQIQIHRIVTNLCSNAAQATGGAPGTIGVSCQMEQVSQSRTAKLRPLFEANIADAITIERQPDDQGGKLWFGSLSAGNYFRLSVKDTGCGIGGAILDRILEPFFTTKDVGQGTGLGLAVVAGTIRLCLGAFVLETEVGQGTRFDVYFPIAE